MKKILIAFLLMLGTLSGFSQVAAPSPGTWIMADSSYNVGSGTAGITKAKLHFANTTTTNISGMQFRVYYDKVAFNGLKPTVSLLYSGSHYMQYVSDSINGHITITTVFTGSSSTFSYADSSAFEITFTHSAPAIFQYLTSIDSLKFTGATTFTNLASSINGNDTLLNTYSYGGAFKMQRLKYHGKFINVTGSGTKNLTVALEKRPKGFTGAWTPIATAMTNTLGAFNFNSICDTTYWDAQLYVKGDTMSLGATISVADAQKVNQFVLGQSTPIGFDFYSSDVNGSNSISISDVYSIYGRLAGRFSAWPNGVQDVKFFTESEYGSINTSVVNLGTTYPGVTNFTFQIVAGMPDSVTYYVLGAGDANGTGFHMARITPIEIINPSNAPKYIIDETVEYDFPTSQIEINMPKIDVKEGSLVSIPVIVKTTGDQVGSVQLAFAYDDEILNFKGIETEVKTMNWMSFINPNNGIIEWAGADMSENKYLANNDEKLITLNFTALKPQADWVNSPLYVIRKFAGNANAKDLSINPTNGVVKVFRLSGGGLGNGTQISVAPNPTNDFTFVTFYVPEDGYVTVGFYDTYGSLIQKIFEGKMYKGDYTYQVDLSSVAPGVYYGVLNTGKQTTSTKAVKQ